MSEHSHTHPFVVSSKEGHRFVTRNGHVTVEDLFHLSLKDLDKMGLALKKDLDGSETESLLTNPDAKQTAAQKEKQAKFETIKLVIDIKEADNKRKRNALEKRQRRERLNELLQQKELEAEGEKSVEDLRKELAELNAEEAETPAEASAS
jgi:hypothetical protein